MMNKPNPYPTDRVGLSSIADLKVTRFKPELVSPAKSTPHELKSLSNLDNQERLRSLAPTVMFYRHISFMEGKDPAKVIRHALAHALVFYYPLLAGRLIEGIDRKLSVDCTGEGVFLVEADADVELVQLGDPPRPPFPCVEQFLSNVPPYGGIVGSSLIYIQVTRLKCSGFIVAHRYNHVMSDAIGASQFLTAVGEIARGVLAPFVTPIWKRELFSSTDPLPYRQSTVIANRPNGRGLAVERSFFFGPSRLLAIRKLVPDNLRPNTTTFEILMACVWRCVTIALELDPEDEVQLNFPVNARFGTNDVVPVGYYGNMFASPVVATSARKLCESPIEYAIRLVQKVKEMGKEEHVSWRKNPPVIPCFSREKCLVVSDLRRTGFSDVDFGWGKPAFSGLAKFMSDPSGVFSSFKKRNGEDGVLVSLSLQGKAMERFETEVNNMLSHTTPGTHPADLAWSP